MVEVYYYVPSNEAGNVVDCGMKLSRWSDKEVVIGGESKKCISALLNPRDDREKFKANSFRCVKFELSPNYCYAADSYLYRVGLKYPVVMKSYTDSIVPLDKYIFGTYRLPECLVTCTVIPGQISLLDKRLDSPILFDNSEDLYINNIIETYKDLHDDFNDAMLYSFYCSLSEAGRMEKVEEREKGIAVFLDKRDGRAYTFKIPDISKY